MLRGIDWLVGCEMRSLTSRAMRKLHILDDIVLGNIFAGNLAD